MIFRADVADLFFKNVDEAAELAKQNPAWSKAAIDRIFSEGLGEISDGVSVADSAKNFQSKLDRHPEKFRLRFSIFGQGEGCENTDFGKIRIGLDTFTPTHDVGPFFKEGVPMTFHFAEMEVEAIDLESAKIRGADLLDRHLAVLNILCADGIPTLCFLSRRYTGNMYDFSIHQEKIGEDWSQGMSSSRIRRPVMLTLPSESVSHNWL